DGTSQSLHTGDATRTDVQSKMKISVNNLDIFAYDKFKFVEKPIKNQLTKLYTNIMEQKCALEKQILQNALSLSSTAPDEIAFRVMKISGYTTVRAGEVIHLIKCIPDECLAKQTNECHNELPVTYKNHTYIFTPISRIVIKPGTPRDCNELVPIMFKIHDSWFQSVLRLVDTIPPPNIQPLTRPTLKYVKPASLATRGIFSTSDLERLRSNIMFPVEKLSINIHHSKRGNRTTHTGGKHLHDKPFGQKIYRQNSRECKSTDLEGIHHIRISQRGYPRTAIWSSVTHLLFHPARPIKTNQANQPEEQQPAETFPTTEEPRPIPPSTSENQHPAHKVHHLQHNGRSP
ncbi:hypothetical protein HN011_001178, partial [Eciton burchellii]